MIGSGIKNCCVLGLCDCKMLQHKARFVVLLIHLPVLGLNLMELRNGSIVCRFINEGSDWWMVDGSWSGNYTVTVL